MKYTIVCFVLVLLAAQSTPAAETSLWDSLVEVTIQHVKEHGPSFEAAELICAAHEHAWSRRTDFADLAIPYLTGDDPEQVAPAIEILYRLRGYRPLQHIGDFEKGNEEFYARLDKAVYDALDHLHSLRSDSVYHRLALYLGYCKTAQAKKELLKIAESPTAKNSKKQALICLAWHRDPQDIEVLLPYMLEDSAAARSLPYHFRNSYGEAAVPYLKRAVMESKSTSARLEAAFQLVHMRVPDGFEYLHEMALRDPEPDGKHFRPFDRIRQFAVDYLELPRDVSAKEEIAAHIARKQDELCRTQR